MSTCQTTDYWYNKWLDSFVSRACIVRVTNKCNEQCPHCCFRSGPNNYRRMSVATAEKVNAWIPKKIALNVMGGELTVLTDYPAIIMAIARGRSKVRIVTNGQWSKTGTGLTKFAQAIKEVNRLCTNVEVAISDDHWHSHRGCLAKESFRGCKTGVNLIPTDDIEAQDLAPLGRAWDNDLVSLKSIPNSYASCKVMCNMMITEDSMISKCPFGYMPWKHFNKTTWDEAQDYIWEWRSEKLSEGMNCNACMEVIEMNRQK